jgi:hypothetical protein
MNRARTRLVLFTILSLYCIGFGLLSADAQSIGARGMNSFPAEEQVSNIVKEGVSRETVIKAFGKPIGRGLVAGGPIWEDSYVKAPPKRLQDDKEGFSGFVVEYIDDKVVSWTPVESGPIIYYTNTTTLEHVEGSNGLAKISFYAVNESQEKSRFVNIPSSSKPTFIKSDPTLVVGKIRAVELREADLGPPNKGKRYGVVIHLLKSDAEAFENMVGQNIGKKIVIMIDEQPVAAPIVTSPITDGQFSVSFQDKKIADEIMRKLKKSLSPSAGP